MKKQLFLAMILACGCEQQSVTPNPEEGCDIDAERWGDMYGQSTVTQEQQVLSFHLKGEQQGSSYWDIESTLQLLNESTEKDCLIAVYLNESPPQLDMVEPLAENTTTNDDNLGELLYVDNLAYTREREDGDSLTLPVSTYNTLAWGVTEFEYHLTIVTCGEAQINVSYSFDFFQCTEVIDEELYDADLSTISLNETTL